MFIGMLKLKAAIVVVYASVFIFQRMNMILAGVIILYAAMFLVTPLAIHGSCRYRMSRTTWRGIRFGYRGNRKEFIINFTKWTLLTLVTVGIYGSWMTINLRKYVLGHIRFGNIECKYNGKGSELFFINLKGIIFSIFTLGIYAYWWQKNIFNYYYNISFHEKERSLKISASATAGGFFKLLVGNLLLVIFTLGFGFAWADVRTMRFVANNIKIEGDIDLNTVKQTEESYTDASGDDAADFFDIDIF
jgi:uncharacterized membrane protein YjgN (DUF898 family)